ncbi:sulfatase-like hydrolase/transferase [Gymnodinialimonas sp. 2305UL16-5]|uniref:sulfatase family protein n=1 Tax=Gymnodinialimonas mytili TaxID=3126503 RepID=UPI0030A24450
MSKRPNILVIFNDDHGQWALPTYGNCELRTPTVDALARSGAVFENAFTPVPVCSPARACFMTGLLPTQHGVHDYLNSAEAFNGRDWLRGVTTLPELLQASGYYTGLSGKWHLGQDFKPQPGFDDWFALAGDYPIFHRDANRFCDNGRLHAPEGYLTQLIADRTVAFLRDRPKDQPFFHFTGFYATHSPWEDQPERLVSLYKNASFSDIPSAERVFEGEIKNIELPEADDAQKRRAKAQYYAAVTAIDEGLGRILDHLDATGTLDNTLIVFTSDHGLCLDHHGIWGKGNATSPQNMIEESIRVPMIFAGPQVPAGVRPTVFADHLDLFQTLTSVAEVTPDNRLYAGRALWSVMHDPGTTWRECQFGEYGTARMIRTETHKLITRLDHRRETLFDLRDGEGQNLIDSEHAIASELRARLRAHFSQFEDHPPDPEEFFGPPRFNPVEAWR